VGFHFSDVLTELKLVFGRAHARHRTDDRKRNAGRDQTIFNHGRPRLIRKELRDLPPQNDLLQGLRRFYPAVHVYI
jgi:hypothetical protein